jgi:glycosyltransferase involved in cell wall biosynthesis
MRRSAFSRRNAAAVVSARRLIRRIRPDVVHGHSSVGGAVARFAAVGTTAKRVYTPNGLFPTGSAYAVERALGRVTDVVVACSPSEAQQVRRLRLIDPNRVVVISNAIELTKPRPASIDLREILGAPPDTPVVGSVGRLVPQKAPEVFVRACAQIARAIPEARFTLIGDGPMAQAVESEVARVGVGERFLLLRDFQGAAAVMGQFDVFALASRYEGAPYAPMEAMRARTPVVLTDVIGNRDIVEHGRSGFVVPPDDPAALGAEVVRLLRDPDARARVAGEAWKKLEAEFDVRVMARSLEALYGRLSRESSSSTERS